SIVAVSDGSGAMFAINTYDEHGIPGAANAGRFQYTGQAWIPEIGMYYYRARIYSPSLGRFLQTDPIGYEAGMNLYAYVRDDPVNASDPTGTIRCNGDPRCPELHRRAWEARQIALAASAELRGLAGAVRGHAKLTPNQRSLLTAFQEKFGRAAARASGLEDAARFFDTVANRIGTEGSGMRANFDPTMRDPARRRSSATPSILGRRSSARQA
ncbi:MAG TPA: RHS repeat-associated core domain-containing protein, partial [Allosphingosinicella sp.]|nr:RHS repeat-associated core domain-containing protein [Allosphingosinicella sp.]